MPTKRNRAESDLVRPRTPPPPPAPIQENHQPRKHYSTPTKAAVLHTVSFLEAHDIPYHKREVFDHLGVNERRGYSILQSGNSRRNLEEETRGRPSKISKKDIAKMDQILQTSGIEGRSLTWQQLGNEAGLDVSGRTIQRAMGTMSYRKCVACKKAWTSKKTAEHRVIWAKEMLAKYPEKEDWRQIRFSDEMHSGFGPQHTLRIIRKPGERHCPDCIQHADEPVDSDRKRQHCWAAVGYNFKSKIVWYEIPSNSNGKMTQLVYRDVILEPIVKPWLEEGQQFVLEEDGDSGHGPGKKKKNIVRTWKEENKLKYYFNCHSSPDLSPIENCWIAPKQTLKKYPHWDDQMTRELIQEGWDGLKQETINQWIDSMPQRLRDVIQLEGQLTGY